MSTLPSDPLNQQLHQDAQRIQINAAPDLTQRIIGQLQALPTDKPSYRFTRPAWAWAVAVPAVLALGILLDRNVFNSPADISADTPPLLVETLELELAKALAQPEDSMRNELVKVENDLQKLGNLFGLKNSTFAK